MNDSVLTIPLANLALAFIPVLAVVGVLFRWSLDYRNALYAALRMLIQLLIIGYFLLFLFESDSVWLVIGVVAVMVSAASWIALGSIAERRRALYVKALLSIAVGGGFVLMLITQGVLDLAPWYSPRYLIPLAGMIFANAMNTVSLAAERFYSEIQRHATYEQARDTAFRASLIPNVNTLFAVGLVALPGMMTGQILAGVSPLIAARYQIMVMCMLFGTAGLASACFLTLLRLRVPGLPQEEDPPLVT
jgi:putative ABC transport system permease protein